MLASLTPEEQRGLAATYEELTEAAGVAIEYGDDGAGEAPLRMDAIAPAEPLLAWLPHATFKASGADDHDLRRRTLTVEVEWAPTPREDVGRRPPVVVTWLDGYQSTVATMSAALIEGSLYWSADPARIRRWCDACTRRRHRQQWRQCSGCEGSFPTTRDNLIYCDDRCRKVDRRRLG